MSFPSCTFVPFVVYCSSVSIAENIALVRKQIAAAAYRAGRQLEEIELKPSPLPDKSAASRVKAQTQDGEILQSTLEKRTGSRRRVVLLDEKGPAKPTLGWAKIAEP